MKDQVDSGLGLPRGQEPASHSKQQDSNYYCSTVSLACSRTRNTPTYTRCFPRVRWTHREFQQVVGSPSSRIHPFILREETAPTTCKPRLDAPSRSFSFVTVIIIDLERPGRGLRQGIVSYIPSERGERPGPSPATNYHALETPKAPKTSPICLLRAWFSTRQGPRVGERRVTSDERRAIGL